jgi:hypothetical protein
MNIKPSGSFLPEQTMSYNLHKKQKTIPNNHDTKGMNERKKVGRKREGRKENRAYYKRPFDYSIVKRAAFTSTHLKTIISR